MFLILEVVVWIWVIRSNMCQFQLRVIGSNMSVSHTRASGTNMNVSLTTVSGSNMSVSHGWPSQWFEYLLFTKIGGSNKNTYHIRVNGSNVTLPHNRNAGSNLKAHHHRVMVLYEYLSYQTQLLNMIASYQSHSSNMKNVHIACQRLCFEFEHFLHRSRGANMDDTHSTYCTSVEEWPVGRMDNSR